MVLALVLVPKAEWAHSAPANSLEGYESACARVSVIAVMPATLRVSLSSINVVAPIEDPNQRSPIITVPVTSYWTVNGATSAVELIGFFDSPANALRDEKGNSIPSGRVLGAIEGEKPQAFDETDTIGTPGASHRFFLQHISRSNVSGSRTDTLGIQVDRVADLGRPAGNYSGVLHLRLVAY
jgi:hypothetical protein